MKKILYIENNLDTAEAVQIILSKEGFDVVITDSGIKGIELSKEKDFDIFLFNIMLHDMSGWEILDNLKKTNSNSKFIILTEFPISNTKLQEFKEAGIHDYISKPFTKNDLIKKLIAILDYKIHYIEDNIDTAEAVRMLLKNAGYNIEISNSGKDAINKEEIYDLFLLDMMLPDMSGWDIFENLKKSRTNSKFAFLTSVDADQKRIDELKEFGVTDYIKKPFTKEDLIKRINKILL